MLRRALLALAVVVGISGAAGGWWAWKARADALYRRGIADAKRAAMAGAPARARQLLDRTASRWPGRGEAEFLLGAVERSLGRLDAARLAWSRVPDGSEYADEAAMMLARLALAGDRMAEAERLLPKALEAEPPLGIEARESLLMLYKLQGRHEEARRLVRDGWDRYPDRVGTLQELWRLDSSNPLPLEEHRRFVDRASRSAPDDDRVLLARSHLMMRLGRPGEAKRLLDACLARRPDDPAVWRGVLDWALSLQDVAPARSALEHLPGDLVPTAELLSLRAWFAARRGDAEGERRALSRLVAVAPGSTLAVDRLGGLAHQAGDTKEAARLRAEKAGLDAAVDRYADRMFQPDPIEAAEELAALAERLGRHFDARGWWALAVARNPNLAQERDEALSRMARAERARARAESLPALLADLRDATPAGRDAPAPAIARAPTFEGQAQAAGLAFTYHSGKSPERQIPETMGTGVGLIDIDCDGWLDVYLTQGGPFPPDPDAPSRGDRLFRNRGDGTFEDATDAAGISGFPQGYGHGVAVGDVDNDGDHDLFITRWGSYALYRNRGDGTFEDATDSAGLGGERDWPTSAAFADLDDDGDLDLYVCHYLVWDPANPRVCDDTGTGVHRLCNPGLFPSRPDRLFRNDGGVFVDVTDAAGIVDDHGRGMGVVAADWDEDGRVDLYVANDQTANFLWRNLGGWRFEEAGHLAGVAASGQGGYQAGMGVAAGDVDRDGHLDLAVTNFYNEGTTYYQNLGRGIFNDSSGTAGLLLATRSLLGFGVAFADFDNDGWTDLAQANGHVDDFRPDSPYAMPLLLMLGDGRGRLVDVSDRAGPEWRADRLGRALATGDLDNDGRVDLIVVPLDKPTLDLRNRTGSPGRWATFGLEGVSSNRDGIGTRVTVSAGGRRFDAWRCGGGSYQSSGDPRLHFGLGTADRIDAVEVRWPSGLVDRFGDLPADAGYLLREGAPAPLSLPGFAPAGRPGVD